MDNQYLSYLQEDPELYAAVNDSLPALQRLSSTQIEQLIFYLKSLHGYYPKSENHTTYWAEFSDKLEKLRNSPEQLSMQRKTSVALLTGVVCCVLAGILLAIAFVALIGAQTSVGVGFIGAAVACILFSDGKLFRKALILSKEQDRKYFLSSIRAAKACNELDWAGLFSYNRASKSGALSDTDLVRLSDEVGELTGKLRASLYNDEYFQYSSVKSKR